MSTTTLPERASVLLAGVVGSTAYGLNHAGSDVDRLGVFAYDTADLHGLEVPDDTVDTHEPDLKMYEAGKFCRLALNGNPSVMELLWLNHYEEMSPFGIRLVKIRSAFLAAEQVRTRYLGYAFGQFEQLEQRNGESFSADTAKRTAKHARHIYRLCIQGFELYATGELRIRVDDAAAIHAFGEQVAGGDVAVAAEMLAEYKAKFASTVPPLPEKTDAAVVENWLQSVREVLFDCGHGA